MTVEYLYVCPQFFNFFESYVRDGPTCLVLCYGGGLEEEKTGKERAYSLSEKGQELAKKFVDENEQITNERQSIQWFREPDMDAYAAEVLDHHEGSLELDLLEMEAKKRGASLPPRRDEQQRGRQAPRRGCILSGDEVGGGRMDR